MEQMSRCQLELIFTVPALATIAVLSYLRYTRQGESSDASTLFKKYSESSKLQDPPILNDNSTYKSYSTRFATYPSIRTFYRLHPHADKLPSEPQPLPLLVFVHGLGGSLAQFAPLLGSLINVAPCLGIDLPGCGLSRFAPTSWDAYSTEALVALLKAAIEEHQAEESNREVILIGHSMGCSLSALLASATAPKASKLDCKVLAVVSICPKSSPPTRKETGIYRKLLLLPDFVFDGLRWLDRRGGTESTSVTRFVGENAGIDLKKLQQRYNEQFPTPVWKRTAWGCLPEYESDGVPHGGLPAKEIWTGVEVPILLIAGEADTVTKPEEVSKIVEYLQHSCSSADPQASDKLDSEPIPTAVNLNVNKTNPENQTTPPLADDVTFGTQPSTTETTSRHSAVVKTAILPAPASHALLYDHAHYRTLAGLIEDFLSKHISEHLSLGWQLQNLTTSGKWDVKNLEKWKGVVPVSSPICHDVFRAFKTLREQDESHTPSVFVNNWSGKIYAIIDISKDSPIYDPKMLEQGGIHYHKFPTVSKIPPTINEVEDFIALVERLRHELRSKGFSTPGEDGLLTQPAIGVHCHYGYNRTGFFIVCYLVEKEGYRVQDAIDEFAKQRAPGIRHDHFIDTLFVRYCVGLKRAPAMSGTVTDDE